MKVKKSSILVILVLAILAIVIFVFNPFASNYKVSIIGATWDIPEGVTLYIDFSDPKNLEDNIRAAALSLAYDEHEHLIVAGQVDGPISNDIYQEIINDAKLINPNYKGSIIRIGGKDRYETQRLINDYIKKYVH